MARDGRNLGSQRPSFHRVTLGSLFPPLTLAVWSEITVWPGWLQTALPSCAIILCCLDLGNSCHLKMCPRAHCPLMYVCLDSICLCVYILMCTSVLCAPGCDTDVSYVFPPADPDRRGLECGHVSWDRVTRWRQQRHVFFLLLHRPDVVWKLYPSWG